MLVKVLLGVHLGSGNLHSVENQELGLVLHQWVAPTTDHLRDTVHGTDEDGDKGNTRGADVESEARGGAGHRVIEVVLCLARPVAAEEEVGSDETAESHGSDLDADTSHHDRVSDLDQLELLASSDTASGSLNEDTGGIGGDEDPGVETGPQSGVLRAEVDDQMLDREVDSSGKEGWRQNQADNLDLEACLTPRVVVHDQSSDITDTFSETSNDNSKGEALQTSLDSEEELGEEQDSKHDTEEDVSSEIRSISIGGCFYRALRCNLCAITASHLRKSRRRCLHVVRL